MRIMLFKWNPKQICYDWTGMSGHPICNQQMLILSLRIANLRNCQSSQASSGNFRQFFFFEIDNPCPQRLREKMQAFNFEVKWVPSKLHLIVDALSRAPHFSPHAKELTVETTFVLLNEEHPQFNQLLTCLTAHIFPEYRDLLIQIWGDFSSKSISQFSATSKN